MIFCSCGLTFDLCRFMFAFYIWTARQVYSGSLQINVERELECRLMDAPSYCSWSYKVSLCSILDSLINSTARTFQVHDFDFITKEVLEISRFPRTID